MIDNFVIEDGGGGGGGGHRELTGGQGGIANDTKSGAKGTTQKRKQ